MSVWYGMAWSNMVRYGAVWYVCMCVQVCKYVRMLYMHVCMYGMYVMYAYMSFTLCNECCVCMCVCMCVCYVWMYA